MSVFPIHDEPLPDGYAKAVGLVIARWARQEALLIEVLAAIVRIGPKEARHIFRTAQGIDYVHLIQELVSIAEISTSVSLSELKTKIQDLRNRRNVIAHALWLKDENGVLCLQDTTGQWKPDPQGPQVTRKMKPEAYYFSPAVAHGLMKEMDETIAITKALLKDISGVPGLPASSGGVSVAVSVMASAVSEVMGAGKGAGTRKKL